VPAGVICRSPTLKNKFNTCAPKCTTKEYNKMAFIDYTAFNPAHAHLTINNNFSLYSVPPTQRNIMMTYSVTDVHMWSQNTMFLIKIVKNI
jgi:hypothetical protein